MRVKRCELFALEKFAIVVTMLTLIMMVSNHYNILLLSQSIGFMFIILIILALVVGIVHLVFMIYKLLK